MKPLRLFTPGPVPVLPAALRAMSQPIIHHRTKDFEGVLEDVRKGLKDLFCTKEEVLVLSSSGTGAMEGVIANLFSPKEKVLVVRAGKFGERWGEIAEAFQLEMISLDIPSGEAPKLSQIQKLYEAHLDAKAILLQACETSTGVDFPIEEIATFTRSQKLLLVVDAISSLGVSPLQMDAWGIDGVVTGSQKGLMLPPGLAFVALSQRAWEKQKSSKLPKYYFDFSKELKAITKNQTAFTPAVSLILGLREVLSYFKEEGKENIFKRYQHFSKAMREGALALHLELFAKRPSQGLLSIFVPQNLDGKKIVSLMRDQHQMMIAAGQGELSSKILRIACIGHEDPFDFISVFSALEDVLKSLGAKIDFGKGVARVETELLGKK